MGALRVRSARDEELLEDDEDAAQDYLQHHAAVGTSHEAANKNNNQLAHRHDHLVVEGQRCPREAAQPRQVRQPPLPGHLDQLGAGADDETAAKDVSEWIELALASGQILTRIQANSRQFLTEKLGCLGQIRAGAISAGACSSGSATTRISTAPRLTLQRQRHVSAFALSSIYRD